MSSAADAPTGGEQSISPEVRLQQLLAPLRHPPPVPPSAALIRSTLADFRALLPEEESNASAAATAAATPSSLLRSFCSGSGLGGSGYATLTSWLWRRDVVSEFAAHCLADADTLFLCWFGEPLPASDAFLALVTATRSVTAGATPAAPAVLALLRTALQQFIELQPRVTALLREVCDEEERRAQSKQALRGGSRHEQLASEAGSASRAQLQREAQRVQSVVAKHSALPTSAVSASTALSPLSASSTLLLDQLCSFLDVLANALRGDLPYSLAHRSWYAAVAVQAQALVAECSAPPAQKSAGYFSPLANLFTKLVRLGQSELLLDAWLEPLIVHLQQLHLPAAASAPTADAGPSSPLLAAYAHIFQHVGVQALERLVEHTLVWLGMRATSARLEQQRTGNAAALAPSEGGQEALPPVSPAEAAVARVMPALFPLSFYSASPFFSLLVSNRFFLAKTSLPPAAVRVLVDYLWSLSLAQLAALPAAEAARQREHHHTLLDNVLCQLVTSWTGGDDGGGAASAAATRAATAMPAETQLYLGKAILACLEKLELVTTGPPPTSQERAKKKEAAKAAASDAEAPDAAAAIQLRSFASSAAMPGLLTGVHVRLSSPLAPVRRNAMLIARVFSRLMGGLENEVDFGGEEEEAPQEQRMMAATAEADEMEGDAAVSKHAVVTLTPASMINPQHLVGAAAASAPPLVAHALADDERDLRKVPLPYFLRDALEMLQKQQDSQDHIEAALEALPALIARHPADLPAVARELMAALLSLGSNVYVETHARLARFRLEAMAALCSTTRGPTDFSALAEAVPYLIAQFWSANYALGTKIEMLDVLRQAAERLAGFEHGPAATGATAGKQQQSQQPLIQEAPSTAGRSLIPVNTPAYASSTGGSSTLAQAQALIAARVESRTRRWGSTKLAAAGNGTAVGSKTAPAPSYSINRFAPVAHLFFFPLMRHIDSPAHAAQLTAHDGLVLLHLLATVSAFLPASSGLAQALPLVTRSMAATLMEFLLVSAAAARGIRSAALGSAPDQAAATGGAVGLRRMVLFALSRVLVVYNPALFSGDFPREVPELVAWLTDTATRDPDAECRQLAMANLTLIKELLPGNPFEALFKNEQNNAAAQASLMSAALPKLRI